MLEIAIKFIKQWEGFKSIPYLDSAGIPTIGYGSIVYPDGVKVSMIDPSITEHQAEAMLRLDLDKRCKSLLGFLAKCEVDLNDNQKAALLSFSYNLGLAPITTPGRSMNKALVANDLDAVAEAFKLYNKATMNGVKMEIQGLTNRRNAERALFLA